MKTTTTDPFTPRIRFNWGFWDGRADASNRRRNREYIPQGQLFCLPSTDKAYREGYARGFRSDLTAAIDSSQPAWRDFQGAAGVLTR